MITICCYCFGYIGGSGEPISSGLHRHCSMIVYPNFQRPALMAPKADRYTDCIPCRFADLDSDGVPDGCGLPIGEKCIAPGKRLPWDSNAPTR